MDPEDDILTPAEDDNQDIDEQQPDDQDGGEGDDDQGEDDDLVLTIEGEAGEEAAEAVPATGLVKHLREQIRERDKRLAALSQTAKPIEVGPKPDLWDDCEGDADKFEAALLEWSERSAQAKKAQQAESQHAEALQTEWQNEHSTYQTQRAAIKLPDFEVAEAAVSQALTRDQQSALILAATNKAAVVAALGRSPARLAEIAKITNPIKFAVAVSKLEGSIKMVSRRKPAEIDEPVRGGAPIASRVDKVEERLSAEASRTGDMTKLFAHQRKKREEARAKSN